MQELVTKFIDFRYLKGDLKKTANFVIICRCLNRDKVFKKDQIGNYGD